MKKVTGKDLKVLVSKVLNEGKHLVDDDYLPPESEIGRQQYLDDLAMTGGDWYGEDEDVEELARYHALNNDVDATLYRDNPDYRHAFKATLTRSAPDEDQAEYSDEYRQMIGGHTPTKKFR